MTALHLLIILCCVFLLESLHGSRYLKSSGGGGGVGGAGGGVGGGLGAGDGLESTLHDIFAEIEMGAKIRNCRTTLEPVEAWLAAVDAKYNVLLSDLMLATYEQASNFNEINALRVQETDRKCSALVMNASAQAYDILQVSRDLIRDCNDTVLKMVESFSKSNALVPLKAEDREKLSNLSTDLARKHAEISLKKDDKTYKLDPDLTNIMSTSRDYDELLWAWKGWHDEAGSVVKEDYLEIVELLTKTAKDRGYKDVAELWQIQDFDEDMEEEMDRLMAEVMPFYTQLHAYVRSKIFDFYSAKVENEEVKSYLRDKSKPIPAHLLGNMYAQEWDNIEDLLLPFPSHHHDVTKNMKEKNYDVHKMFKMAEEFFVSLGFDPMTEVFWNKSIVERVPQVTMECHPSAYDMNVVDDYRIMMCAEVVLSHFQTIHHEMGHVVYYMQYRHLPLVFREGANAAFHEAIGDTIALSVNTQPHLKKVELIEESQGTNDDEYKKDINSLMEQALSKLAFVPFGYIVDKWRFKVFRGEITQENFNMEWWKIRLKHQGIIPPVDRTNAAFDPGAKYHVPANVPYSRYFFSFIGQFQFHEALCRQTGHAAPLHQCDIFQSTEAGSKLKEILREGSRTPWRQLMHKFTGSSNFNSSSLLSYFKPLYDWLLEQNRDVPVGWESS